MIKQIIFISIILFINKFINSTPLEGYLNKIDNTYKWTLNNTIQDDTYTGYILELTSQTWMTSKESNSPVWKHWVSICVPKGVTTNKTILYIDGNENTDWEVPTEIDQTVKLVCLYSGSVAVGLTQIPNQPIIFNNDGVPRIEDNLIAYAWGEYLGDTSNAEWLPRLPMTKALIKCMDAVQEFGKTIDYNTNQFIITGASKRGWVAWLSVLDSRVVAIIPITMPILNIVPNWGHQYQAYGNWSFAMLHYLNAGVMNYFNGQPMKDLASVIDPITYNNRLTVPIYTITASGDEFFILDSPSFFWKNLTNTNEKHLRIVANTDHSMNGYQIDVMLSIVQFVKLIVSDTPRPQFTWDITYSADSNSGTIIVTLSELNTIAPYQVNLWEAVTESSERRDFRMTICADDTPNCKQNTTWVSTLIDPTNTNVYSVSLSKPESGWRAFFIEVVYQVEENNPLTFTTEVAIVPNTLPFGTCYENDACGDGTSSSSSTTSTTTTPTTTTTTPTTTSTTSGNGEDSDSSVGDGNKIQCYTNLIISFIFILNLLI